MSLTFIDTNKISHAKLPGSGEFAEILNDRLCGAKNVVGSLRWLNPGEKLDVRSDKNTHQLVYLMQGEATITLGNRGNQACRHGSIETFSLGCAAPAELSSSSYRCSKVFRGAGILPAIFLLSTQRRNADPSSIGTSETPDLAHERETNDVDTKSVVARTLHFLAHCRRSNFNARARAGPTQTAALVGR
jgi:hypothetical protein